MKLMSRFASLILLIALGVAAGLAIAQSYPNRPIRIVVPFTPGGALDTTARIISPKMAETMNQPVVVENRPGASGIIGADLVAKAAPDGYTILLDTGLAIRPALYRKLPFDAAKDLVPVTQLISNTMILVASSRVPIKSTGELIAAAKSKPGALTYGHTGINSPLFLIMELLKLSAGIEILGVPYKGDAQISIALNAGEVDVAFVPLASNLQAVKTSRLRALGVSTAKRAAVLPDVPTVAEGGVTGYEYAGWQAFYVPAKTPRSIIEVIQREAVKALNASEVRDRIVALGLEPIGSTQQEVDAKYRADLEKFARIVREARIPLQD